MPSVFGPQSSWDDPREAGEAELARLAAQFEEDERDPMWKLRHDGGFTSRANRVSGARPGLTKVIYMSVGCFG